MNSPSFEMELPILQEDPRHIFTPTELARCASGDCMRCGRCCFLYKVIVPRTVGTASYQADVKPWFVEKGSVESCPQHCWNEEGLSTCACHNQKKMPIMEACNEFQPGPKVYQEVRALTRQALYRIENLSQLAIMEDWADRGLLSDAQIEPSSFDELANAIVAVLKIADHFPSKLLDAMGALDVLGNAKISDFSTFDQTLEKVCSPQIYAEWQTYTASIGITIEA